MCTYQTEHIDVRGSGKGARGWFALQEASVYYDHPVHAQDGHTVNIDFLAPEAGPSARVAVEMDRASAAALAEAITRTLEATPDLS